MLGAFLSLDGGLALKGFFTTFGCSVFVFQSMDGGFITDFRWIFLFTQSLMNLEFSQIFLFIGINLRLELPVLNTKIRKSYLEWGNLFSSYSIGGFHMFSGYPIQNLGCSIKSYANFFLGRTLFFKQLFGLTYKANWFLVNYNRIFNLNTIKPLVRLASLIE